MKRYLALLLVLPLLLWGCGAEPEETTIQTLPAETVQTEPPLETAAPTETTPPVVVELSEEDQQLLLKIGMAELGEEACPQCIALVMCTVLNRTHSRQFSDTVRGVIYAKGQFTPVGTKKFEEAEPNESCYEALDMVIHGWDESQGALFYEFCQGPSWHSRNLKLLTEHCNTRFYK